MKILLAAVLSFQTGLFLITLVTQVWYSSHLGQSDGEDDSTNETLNINSFLTEYDKYCSLQLVPKTSHVATGNKSYNKLCDCVPDTLGEYG